MNPYIIIAVVAALLAGFGGFLWLLKGQKNLLLAWDPDADTIQPVRRRTMTGNIRYKRRDGQRVKITMQPGYGLQRQDAKGSVLMANVKTGQAMRPTADGKWVSLDGIYLELAYADDTVQKIRAGTAGQGITLKHVMIVLGVIVVLLVVVVYQFAKAGGL